MKYVITKQIHLIVVDGKDSYPERTDLNFRDIAIVITQHMAAYFYKNNNDSVKVMEDFISIIDNTSSNRDSETKMAIQKFCHSNIEFIKNEFKDKIKYEILNSEEQIKEFAAIVGKLTLNHLTA